MFKEFLKVLGDSLRIEKFASRNGLLQRIDPRVKLLAFTGFIVVAVLLQNIIQFLLMLSCLIILAVGSRIPLRAFFGRQSMLILFSLTIVLPLPFITPGYALLTIPVGPWFVWVTFEGMYRAVFFLLRVWLCVSALSLLTLTTRFNSLIHGMERLRFPRLFIQLTAITYRFIFLFTDEAYRMGLARQARTVHKERVVRLRTWRTISSMIGSLFVRAYERGEKVYQAMLARGYTGKFQMIDELHFGVKDFGFGLALLAVACLIYFAPVFFPITWIGGWF
ncbi:MAG: cobalt ECF transporter T component CbiQ [Promethearchaeota archaeon]